MANGKYLERNGYQAIIPCHQNIDGLLFFIFKENLTEFFFFFLLRKKFVHCCSTFQLQKQEILGLRCDFDLADKRTIYDDFMPHVTVDNIFILVCVCLWFQLNGDKVAYFFSVGFFMFPISDQHSALVGFAYQQFFLFYTLWFFYFKRSTIFQQTDY